MWDTKESWMGQQGLHPGANPPAGFNWAEYQRGQELTRQAREADDRRRNAAWNTPMDLDAMDTTSRPLRCSQGSGSATGSDATGLVFVLVAGGVMALVLGMAVWDIVRLVLYHLR